MMETVFAQKSWREYASVIGTELGYLLALRQDLKSGSS